MEDAIMSVINAGPAATIRPLTRAQLDKVIERWFYSQAQRISREWPNVREGLGRDEFVNQILSNIGEMVHFAKGEELPLIDVLKANNAFTLEGSRQPASKIAAALQLAERTGWRQPVYSAHGLPPRYEQETIDALTNILNQLRR